MPIDILQETEQDERYWKDRNAQIDEDRRMIALLYPPAQSDKNNLISNEPKVFYDTAVALVSSFPPRFRMPLSINYEAEEKEKIAKSERFLTGIFRQLDRRQLARGQCYWLRDFAYWIMSGWFAVFTIVIKQGAWVEFIADFYDPMTVYPTWDSEGLARCIRSFETDTQTAMMLVQQWEMSGLKIEEFQKPSPDARVKVVNYWRRDYRGGKPLVRNALCVNGQIVKPLTE